MGLHANAIRVVGSGCESESPIINVMLYKNQNVTDEQWKTIKKSMKDNGGIYYDILDDDGKLIHSGSLPSNKIGKLKLIFNVMKYKNG